MNRFSVKLVVSGYGWVSLNFKFINYGISDSISLSDAFPPFESLVEFLTDLFNGRSSSMTIDEEGSFVHLDCEIIKRSEFFTLTVNHEGFKSYSLRLERVKFVEEFIKALHKLVNTKLKPSDWSDKLPKDEIIELYDRIIK